MPTRALISIGAAAAAAVMAAPAVPAAASSSCDAYSHHCTNVKPRKIVRPPTEVLPERSTLPFTGGEIVLMTLAGSGAIGAGTAFVVAGRRRRRATPA
jgi:hypothetical protein